MDQSDPEIRTNLNRRAWWLVLAACFAALSVYGVVQLTERPRIETITTSSPALDSNNGTVRQADYHPARHSKRN